MKNKGFTIIELMIAIAIIGILAAIAVPQYNNYTTRAKISEGLSMVASAKTAVAEFKQSKGVWPSASDAGIIDSALKGTYVSSILIDPNSGGANPTVLIISYDPQATFGNASKVENQLYFTAFDSDGTINWKCSAPNTTGVEAKYLPVSCK